MSMTFTKLFSSITESTIWVAPDAHRLCWITMLAMADSRGRVWASVPGLANRARITVPAAEQALKSFLGPDPYSRTKDHDGQRIEEIDGGWRLLNHSKYRAIRDAEAILEAKRKYINTRRAVENVDRGRHNAEAESEAEKKKQDTVGLKPDIRLLRKQAVEILNFLNDKTGRNYQPVAANIDLIVARLKDGATLEDCRQVIAKKAREWKGDAKMDEYLRPLTLFNRTKFAQYQGELGKEES